MLAHISYRPKLLSTFNENSHQTSTENFIESSRRTYMYILYRSTVKW